MSSCRTVGRGLCSLLQWRTRPRRSRRLRSCSGPDNHGRSFYRVGRVAGLASGGAGGLSTMVSGGDADPGLVLVVMPHTESVVLVLGVAANSFRSLSDLASSRGLRIDVLRTFLAGYPLYFATGAGHALRRSELLRPGGGLGRVRSLSAGTGGRMVACRRQGGSTTTSVTIVCSKVMIVQCDTLHRIDSTAA